MRQRRSVIGADWEDFRVSPGELLVSAAKLVISFVQPPVKAAGKNASTTVFLPRKSESFTGWPFAPGSVKSGAISPNESTT
jgi:hypothetical protein